MASASPSLPAVPAAPGAMYASLNLVAGEGEDLREMQPAAGRWSRAKLALAAASGLAVCGAALTMGGRRALANGESTSMRALAKPFQKYDPNAPGGMPMPSTATQYDGIEDQRWMKVVHNQWDEAHIFAVGDWGAPLKTGHITAGSQPGLDDHAQYSVANAMKGRAVWAKPQYILNVGDNFYYGGIDMDCNSPPQAAWGKAKADFSSGWQGIYGELANIPWLSTLGNHDYGGWQFNMGWPQQIGYSFVNHNWVMPARYYTKKVSHPSFLVEYFFIDSNVYDALDPPLEANHNICSQQHNPGGAQCTGNNGMANVWSCKDWFWGSYKAQKAWLEQKVIESKADWKIVVTHFPCGYDGSFYRGLHEKHGLDLLVTGHRHQQELWWPGTKSHYIRDFMNKNDLGDLACFVTGGGGGISAEKFADADYGKDLIWYGFFDLTISRWYMKIELVGLDGQVAGNYTIKPHSIRTASTTTTPPPTTTAEPTTTTAEKPKQHAEAKHDDHDKKGKHDEDAEKPEKEGKEEEKHSEKEKKGGERAESKGDGKHADKDAVFEHVDPSKMKFKK